MRCIKALGRGCLVLVESVGKYCRNSDTQSALNSATICPTKLKLPTTYCVNYQELTTQSKLWLLVPSFNSVYYGHYAHK